MRIQSLRSLASASLLAAGLVAWSGCNAENPDGTKTELGKIEDKAGKIEKNIEAEAKKDLKVVGEKLKEGVDATGKVIEKTGEKLETSGKEAAEKHVGETAGKVVEKTGEALDKTGEKIQESVKKKD
jgi:colicin import membrane protein